MKSFSTRGGRGTTPNITPLSSQLVFSVVREMLEKEEQRPEMGKNIAN